MQIILGDVGVLIPSLRLSYLDADEMRRLSRFAEVIEDSERGLIVRRNRRFAVGRTIIHGIVFVCPPPMATSDFLSMLYLAYGGALGDAIVLSDVGGGALDDNEVPDAFLIGIAVSLLEEAEHVFRSRIAKSYISEIERRQLLVGRPLWQKSFGRHSAFGVECLVNRLSTNTVHNQILYAGLLVAVLLLEGTSFRERAENQLFVWRGLVTPRQITGDDFISVERNNNRLTSHYGKAMALSRALVLGAGAEDVFALGDFKTLHFELSLPGLFERLIVQLLKPLESYGLSAKFKSVDSGAFINGFGEIYREIEPDITIWLKGRPVAVVDAKFKPRYTRAQLDGGVAYSDRVTNEDLYQLFFYQSRLQNQYELSYPPLAIIVAPLLGLGCRLSRAPARKVVWRDVSGRQANLQVEPIDFPALTKALRGGLTDMRVLSSAAPEFSNSLIQLVDNEGSK